MIDKITLNRLAFNASVKDVMNNATISFDDGLTQDEVNSGVDNVQNVYLIFQDYEPLKIGEVFEENGSLVSNISDKCFHTLSLKIEDIKLESELINKLRGGDKYLKHEIECWVQDEIIGERYL